MCDQYIVIGHDWTLGFFVPKGHLIGASAISDDDVPHLLLVNGFGDFILMAIKRKTNAGRQSNLMEYTCMQLVFVEVSISLVFHVAFVTFVTSKIICNIII